MSIYAIDHLCREVMRNPAFREAMRQNPAAAVRDLKLTDAERSALLHGEVGTLFAMGANAFLLGWLPRFGLLDLTVDSYRDRLIAASHGIAGERDAGSAL